MFRGAFRESYAAEVRGHGGTRTAGGVSLLALPWGCWEDRRLLAVLALLGAGLDPWPWHAQVLLSLLLERKQGAAPRVGGAVPWQALPVAGQGLSFLLSLSRCRQWLCMPNQPPEPLSHRSPCPAPTVPACAPSLTSSTLASSPPRPTWMRWSSSSSPTASACPGCRRSQVRPGCPRPPPPRPLLTSPANTITELLGWGSMRPQCVINGVLM